MKYLQLNFDITPCDEAAGDVLAALLADAGCDSFEPTVTGLTAYVQEALYDADAVRAAVEQFPFQGVSLAYTCTPAPDENWNATWEDGHHFLPIDLPDGQQITILPRQAFGSGEHATTRMMLALLADARPDGRTVIDAGCGTGVLAIAAERMGASEVFAYDIDEWSVNNAHDNCRRNECTRVTIAHGDAAALAQAPKADIIMANINLNILLADLPRFDRQLATGGHLLLSGFLQDDVPALCRQAERLGMTLCGQRAEDEWRALHFTKLLTT